MTSVIAAVPLSIHGPNTPRYILTLIAFTAVRLIVAIVNIARVERLRPRHYRSPLTSIALQSALKPLVAGVHDRVFVSYLDPFAPSRPNGGDGRLPRDQVMLEIERPHRPHCPFLSRHLFIEPGAGGIESRLVIQPRASDECRISARLRTGQPTTGRQPPATHSIDNRQNRCPTSAAGRVGCTPCWAAAS